MLDAKAALWEAGYPSGFEAAARERGRPVPGVVLAGSSYLLSQADTGMVCSLGMTSGVAGLVEAYAPTTCGTCSWPACGPPTWPTRWTGRCS